MKKKHNINHTFALIGAAGYIAPRHLEAIKALNGNLIAASDPNDSVGILDKHFPETKFFISTDRFERFLFTQKSNGAPVDFVSICSPNHLHDTHCRLALNCGADAICEKPLVILPENLNRLRLAERETGKRIFCILQLRHHEKIVKLREMVQASPSERFKVSLEYITSRGPWYDVSWKGDNEKSGGILSNIGIHFFDMLLNVFGEVESFEITHLSKDFSAGHLRCFQADINWKLSTDRLRLPKDINKPTFREIKINGNAFEFSSGFTELHTKSYQNIINGQGFGLDEVSPSLELVANLRKLGEN